MTPETEIKLLKTINGLQNELIERLEALVKEKNEALKAASEREAYLTTKLLE